MSDLDPSDDGVRPIDFDPLARLVHPFANVLTLPRIAGLIDALDGLLQEVDALNLKFRSSTLELWGEYVMLRDLLERLTLSLMAWEEYGTTDPANLRPRGILTATRRRLARYLRSGSQRLRELLNRR